MPLTESHDLFELLRRRRSIRVYQSRPIARAILLQVLEAARTAPSAGNLQAFEIVVCEEPERRRALARAALDQPQVAQAPAVLVFLEHRARALRRYGPRGGLYAIQDATIACAHAQLAAVALGLGSCWIGAFYKEPVSELLRTPLEAIALLTLGYPDESPPPTSRRPLDSLVHWEVYEAGPDALE